MIDAYQLGARVAQFAFRYSGACGCAPFRPRMREALGLTPTEWFDWRVFVNGKQGVSTCFMFAENMWRLGGIDVPDWHIGDFVSTLRAAVAAAMTTAGLAGPTRMSGLASASKTKPRPTSAYPSCGNARLQFGSFRSSPCSNRSGCTTGWRTGNCTG